MKDPRIIIALDFSSTEQALFLAKKLDPMLCRVKI
jgi:orotidine-5'-phosphate decarboxylase